MTKPTGRLFVVQVRTCRIISQPAKLPFTFIMCRLIQFHSVCTCFLVEGLPWLSGSEGLLLTIYSAFELCENVAICEKATVWLGKVTGFLSGPWVSPSLTIGGLDTGKKILDEYEYPAMHCKLPLIVFLCSDVGQFAES